MSLNGFSNNNIQTGLRTSDIGAAFHSCTTGNGTNCTVSDQQSSIPKNIGNIVCLPSTVTYLVTSTCQNLLNQGSSSGCQKNSAPTNCGLSSTNSVRPTCNWRTQDNKSVTASWNWTLTWDGANNRVNVDCAETGYQSYTQ